jgi:hypothetical protein
MQMKENEFKEMSDECDRLHEIRLGRTPTPSPVPEKCECGFGKDFCHNCGRHITHMGDSPIPNYSNFPCAYFVPHPPVPKSSQPTPQVMASLGDEAQASLSGYGYGDGDRF